MPSYHGAMGALEQIRASIPEFEGYGDEESRARSDELIRSYLGERLSQFEDGHPEWLESCRDAFERLLFRCEFMNQDAFKPFEHVPADDPCIPKLLDADVQVLALADHVAALQGAEVPEFLQKVNAVLDRRDAAMCGL
ncbi:MAG: hypothetical protein ACXWNJ_14825 [Vulcanimicrobiaceae bacterium]